VAGEFSALLLIVAHGSEIEGCNMKSTFDWIVSTNVIMEGGDLDRQTLFVVMLTNSNQERSNLTTDRYIQKFWKAKKQEEVAVDP
jgi:hypothetical protein